MLLYDHLGSLLEPGACLCWSTDSPKAPPYQDRRMHYGILQEIKYSKARHGAPILSVQPLCTFTAFVEAVYSERKWKLDDIFKRQGLQNPHLVTVIDFDRLPDEYQAAWPKLEYALATKMHKDVQKLKALCSN